METYGEKHRSMFRLLTPRQKHIVQFPYLTELSSHKKTKKYFVSFDFARRALIGGGGGGGGCIFIYSCYAQLISFQINPNNN